MVKSVFLTIFVHLLIPSPLNYAQEAHMTVLAASDPDPNYAANTCTVTTAFSATLYSNATIETYNSATTTTATGEPAIKKISTGCEIIKFEDIVNKNIVAVEKRKQEAKYNKIIVTNEDEIMLCLTKLGLPKILYITAPKGRAPIWRFYFSLCSKVSVKFEKKTAITGIESLLTPQRRTSILSPTSANFVSRLPMIFIIPQL